MQPVIIIKGRKVPHGNTVVEASLTIKGMAIIPRAELESRKEDCATISIQSQYTQRLVDNIKQDFIRIRGVEHLYTARAKITAIPPQYRDTNHTMLLDIIDTLIAELHDIDFDIVRAEDE